MQVICTDGTAFACEGFELTEYGVMVYGQELDPDDERYAGDPEQTGYVPHDRVWYILPDGVEPNVPAQTGAQGQPGQQVPVGDQQSLSGQPQAPPGHAQQAPGQQGLPPAQRGPEQR